MKNKKQNKNKISSQLEKSSDDILFNLPDSTLEFITKTIGRKWAFQIILQLKKHGTLRNKELVQILNGISPSTLSSFLKELQKQRLIRREIHGQTPPFQVDYSLTNQGRDLFTFLLPLFNYISRLQQTNCVGCDCTAEDCKNNKSPHDCSCCKNDYCCCWQYFHKK